MGGQFFAFENNSLNCFSNFIFWIFLLQIMGKTLSYVLPGSSVVKRIRCMKLINEFDCLIAMSGD